MSAIQTLSTTHISQELLDKLSIAFPEARPKWDTPAEATAWAHAQNEVVRFIKEWIGQRQTVHNNPAPANPNAAVVRMGAE